MHTRLVVSLFSALLLIASAHAARGQTSGELAAFDAFIVSPFGGVAPLARDYAGALPPRAELSLRYGLWRYDINDAVHDNGVATVAVRLGQSRTTLDLSGAYLSTSCDCNPWFSASVGTRTVVFSSAAPIEGRPGVTSHVALSTMLGIARYSSTPAASGTAAQASIDVGLAIPLSRGTRLALSVFPGYAGGHFVSDDLTNGGRSTTLGGALSFAFSHGFLVDLGAQRFMIAGSPTVYGLGFSWQRR